MMSKYPTILEIIDWMENLAPQSFACDWDSVGLQIGYADRTVKRCLLALDFSTDTWQYAKSRGYDFIIVHHPCLFNGTKTLIGTNPEQRIFLEAIQADISIYAAHTNLDSAPGGVNEALLDRLGFQSLQTLLPLPSEQIPEDYSTCNAKMIFPNLPESIVPGDLRLTIFETPRQAFDLIRHIQQTLSGPGYQVNSTENTAIKRLVVLGGAYDGHWNQTLVKHHVDFLLTGEIKYHDLLTLKAHHITAMSIGHDVSERVVLPYLQRGLSLAFPDARFEVYEGLEYNHITC